MLTYPRWGQDPRWRGHKGPCSAIYEQVLLRRRVCWSRRCHLGGHFWGFCHFWSERGANWKSHWRQNLLLFLSYTQSSGLQHASFRPAAWETNQAGRFWVHPRGATWAKACGLWKVCRDRGRIRFPPRMRRVFTSKGALVSSDLSGKCLHVRRLWRHERCIGKCC